MTAKDFLEMLIRKESEDAEKIILDTDSWHYEWTPKETLIIQKEDTHTHSVSSTDVNFNPDTDLIPECLCSECKISHCAYRGSVWSDNGYSDRRTPQTTVRGGSSSNHGNF